MTATFVHSSNDTTIAIMPLPPNHRGNRPSRKPESTSNADDLADLRSIAQSLLEQKVLIDTLRVGLTALSPHCSSAARPVIESMLERLEQASHRCRDMTPIDRKSRRVLGGFLEALSRRYPPCTDLEARICVLLRIGLSPADTATLLSMTERSFEAQCRPLTAALTDENRNLVEAIREMIQ